MKDEYLISQLGMARALVAIGGLEKKMVDREVAKLPALSPYILKRADAVKNRILKDTNYQKPTILQRIGLKKS